MMGAVAFGRPVGLIIVTSDANTGEGSVLSLYVLPAYRGRGIARALLNRVEDLARVQGLRKLKFKYTKERKDPFDPGAFLEKLGWSALDAEWIVARGYVPPCRDNPRIVRSMYFHKDVQPFSWLELRPEERSFLRSKVGEEDWYPEYLSPFVYEDRIEPLTSMGLRYQGEVVGWLVCHRMSADVIRYTSLFARRDLAARGHTVRLLLKAFRDQMESGIPIATLQMRPDNEPMVKMVDRLISPYLESYYVSGVSNKALC